MKEGRKPEYPEKIPNTKLHSMPHANAPKLKTCMRLKHSLQDWWHAGRTDMLTHHISHQDFTASMTHPFSSTRRYRLTNLAALEVLCCKNSSQNTCLSYNTRSPSAPWRLAKRRKWRTKSKQLQSLSWYLHTDSSPSPTFTTLHHWHSHPSSTHILQIEEFRTCRILNTSCEKFRLNKSENPDSQTNCFTATKAPNQTKRETSQSGAWEIYFQVSESTKQGQMALFSLGQHATNEKDNSKVKPSWPQGTGNYIGRRWLIATGEYRSDAVVLVLVVAAAAVSLFVVNNGF